MDEQEKYDDERYDDEIEGRPWWWEHKLDDDRQRLNDWNSEFRK